MPIIIPREGSLPPAPDMLTQAQRDMLWESIVKNWAGKHPEAFNRNQENTYDPQGTEQML